jgi:2-oxoglutarate ferredoxin oxidoreductase subunit beta
MKNENDFDNEVEIQWCPGCPNFAILQTFKRALAQLELSPDRVCLVSGIGQAAKLPHYLKCNFFNGLHGRALPAALGIHIANPKLKTIVVTGDGDCYGEGGNHFIHMLRRNPDITIVVHNNEIYALTKGQASPTTPQGEKRSLQVKGVEIAPINMLGAAILHHCGFVARGFAGDMDHLKELLTAAIQYPGLSVLEIMQPCITWGTHPVKWYRERVYHLGDNHDPRSRSAALELTEIGTDRIPIGIYYQGPPRPTFGGRFRESTGSRALAALDPIGAELTGNLLSEFRQPSVSHL